MLVIRQAILSDMKQLAKIQTNSWRDSFFNILTPETLRKYTNPDSCEKLLESVFNSQKGNFYIALFNSIPCGEVFWCLGSELKNSAEIVAFHISKSFWNNGIGTALLQHVINEIQPTKVDCIYLWVFQENIRARKFYEKLGFSTDNCIRNSRLDNVTEIRYIYTF